MSGTVETGVVVLDRIEPGAPRPDYCIHGRASCMGGCGEWLWLGDKTLQVVQSGKALPMCRPCAGRHIPAGTPLVEHIQDRRRTEGPH